MTGDASDPEVTARAAGEAESHGELVGWVNNAAVFGDLGIRTASPEDVLAAITVNLSLAVTGATPRSATSWPTSDPGRSSTSRPTRHSARSAAP